jgi:hypothetical protein
MTRLISPEKLARVRTRFPRRQINIGLFGEQELAPTLRALISLWELQSAILPLLKTDFCVEPMYPSSKFR